VFCLFFGNGLLRTTLWDFAWAVPGLIAMFVARKSLRFLYVWVAGFTVWAFLMISAAGVDLHDPIAGVLLAITSVVSVASFFVAVGLLIVERLTRAAE
jgi:hypothetical protein